MANIRETDAIVQVVRCFENDDIIHELGTVDPLRDVEIINAELILADHAALEKKNFREKKARSGDKEAKKVIWRNYCLILMQVAHHNTQINDDEKDIMKEFF